MRALFDTYVWAEYLEGRESGKIVERLLGDEETDRHLHTHRLNHRTRMPSIGEGSKPDSTGQKSSP